MAIVVGTNSWVTIAEADTYLTDRIGATEWFALADTGSAGADSKTAFIVSSFFWLYRSAELVIPLTSTDDDVKNAQSEAALYLLGNYTELESRRSAMAQGVTEFQYLRRIELLDITKLAIPQHISGMLSAYLQLNGIATLKGEYDV